MDHGNAVLQSPFEEGIVYVTTHSGSLIALSAKDGDILATVNPTPISRIVDDGKVQQWSLSCNSGISFSTTQSGNKFLVYSIVDEPPEFPGLDFMPKARVVAVSIPSHKIMWTSEELPGIPSGTPLVYANQLRPATAMYIVLIHNSRITKPDNTTTQTGHIALLNPEEGSVIFEESEWTLDDSPLGYAPASLTSTPIRGMYAGGKDNQNTIVVWASNDANGRGAVGRTYIFQLPRGFKEEPTYLNSLQTKVLKSVSWNAVVKPAINSDGTKLFFGISKNELRGWISDDSRFDHAADWSSQRFKDHLDPKAPIPSAPVLSMDENRLFVSSSAYDLASIDTRSGKANWVVSGTYLFLSEARVSADDKRLYVAQSADGRIFCLDQLTGDYLWQGSCDQFEEDCSNSVRSDFDLSLSGQFLFFADVKGRLISLKLGEMEDAEHPTSAPIWPGPFLPTSNVDWNSNTPEDEVASDSAPGGTIALIVLTAIFALSSTVYIIIVRRRKNLEPRTLDTFPDENVYGPDPYEDSLIIEHSSKSMHPEVGYAPEPGPVMDDFNAFSRSFESDDSSIDGPYFHPADRISVLMGTANRIAPLQEDFSYGASVLV
jgi:outer membrane protein assembly factor BamB